MILFISYSLLIHVLFIAIFISCSFLFVLIHFFIPYSFLFISYSLPEKKANAASDPIQNLEYIFRCKIQCIIPNTFTNEESIAHKDSLHNQSKNFISYPSIVFLAEGFINHFQTLLAQNLQMLQDLLA